MNDLQVTINTLPTGEIEWNYTEIKEGITAIAAQYEGAVYTEETLKQAKADRAELNKLATAIDNKRKEVKNILLAPYNRFDTEVKDVLELLRHPANAIDAQVKDYEQQQKEKKLQTIREMYEHGNFMGVPFETIYDPKWLNATVRIPAIEKELAKIEREIDADMAILEMQEEFRFEATQTYYKTRNLTAAIQTVQQLKAQAQAKAEFEARMQQQAQQAAERPEPEKAPEQKPEITYTDDGLPDIDALGDTRKTIVIRATVTDDEEAALLAFLREKHYDFLQV